MELQRDCNAVTNVGGDLTYWQSVTGGGGELVEYPATPVGGPPAINFCDDARSPYEWTLVANIPGATQNERDAFIEKYKIGTKFTVASSPAGSGEMFITGEGATEGTSYFVSSANVTHTFQDNSTLTITLKENGTNSGESGGGS